MDQISISKFKATCLAVIERVRQTREPILVTRRGLPVAEIRPPHEERAGSWIGSMQGTLAIDGDIVASITDSEDTWEVLGP